jgi:glycine cleavage system T protein (aminomethyltransferase)
VSLLLKTTPFHRRTFALSQGYAWRRWAGYVMASSYELSHEREYAAIRSAAALFDVTPLFKYQLTGPDAAVLLDRVVTRDMRKCEVGQVFYTPWCDSAGKVLDDGTVARLEDHFFRLTSAEPSLRWLRMNAVGLDARIEDVTDRIAALSLQGPTSRAVLKNVGASAIDSLKFFRLQRAELRGIPVTITRTGYTGDLGFEVWMANEHAEAIWDAIASAGLDHGLVPSGLVALDIARIEAGLILQDVDYISANHALIAGQKSSPFELNLGWTVARGKGPYVGQRALEAERARDPEWTFVGLDVEWESLEALYAAVHLPPRLPSMAWRTSVPIYKDGTQIGYATSGCWSPLLKKYVALAHLRAPHGAVGQSVEMEITVEHHRRRASATVGKLPFFDPERKRK